MPGPYWRITICIPNAVDVFGQHVLMRNACTVFGGEDKRDDAMKMGRTALLGWARDYCKPQNKQWRAEIRRLLPDRLVDALHEGRHDKELDDLLKAEDITFVAEQCMFFGVDDEKTDEHPEP